MDDNRRNDRPVKDLTHYRRAGEHEARVARKALEHATDGVEPDVRGLLDRTPEILAEAMRRRAGSAPDALDASIALARWAIPRLAVAALLLVVVSGTLLWRQSGDAGDSFDRLDELVLGVDENGATVDQLFDTLFTPEG